MNYLCSFCSLQSDNFENYLKHIKLVHPDKKSFSCVENTCQKRFSKLKVWLKHIKINHCTAVESQKQNHENSSDIEYLDEWYQTLKNTEPKTYMNNEPCTASAQLSGILKEGRENLINDNLCRNKRQFCSQEDENRDFSENNSEKKDDNFGSNVVRDEINFYESSRLLETHLESELADIVSEMFSFQEIPRKKIVHILKRFQMFLSGQAMNELKDLVIKNFTNLGVDSTCISNNEKIFNLLPNVFNNFSTDYKILNYFAKKKTYVAPIQVKLGEREEQVRKNNEMSIIYIKATAEMVPVRAVLTQFFELPGIFQETSEYYDTLTADVSCFSNIVQGSLWKKKVKKYENKKVFPLIIAFDDFETNNALGSHRSIAKCGAVYTTVPCLIEKHQAKLKNIFLFMLFNSLDRAVFKNKIVFAMLIEEIQYLQKNGVKITVNGEKIQLFFVLIQILGDNLGLNQILGYTESFRANYPCRVCKTHRDSMSLNWTDDNCTLRTEQNYKEDLEKSEEKSTGIKESCVFNELEDFHVTMNTACDAMHDLPEGICDYDLAIFLYYFIFVKKYFTLSKLHSRLRFYDYGKGDSKNKPPEISSDHIKKGKLHLSAAETLCFNRHITLIIGEFIPEDDDVWKLVILLQKIVNFVTDYKFLPGSWFYLKSLVEDYLSNFMDLFPGKMRPKHHFLSHYWRTMQLLGPLWKISTIRYESKHHEALKSSKTVTSRVNISRTIAIRIQMSLNHILRKKEETQDLEFNIPNNPKALKYDPLFFEMQLLLNKEFVDDTIVLSEIMYMGKVITENSVFVTFAGDDETFYIVKKIMYSNRRNDISFFCIIYENLFFDYHFQAYVENSSVKNEKKIISSSIMFDCQITHLLRAIKTNFILKKWC